MNIPLIGFVICSNYVLLHNDDSQGAAGIVKCFYGLVLKIKTETPGSHKLQCSGASIELRTTDSKNAYPLAVSKTLSIDRR